MSKMYNPTFTWKPATDRPQPDKGIIILTDNGDVRRGYMSMFHFPGETNPSYAYHARYYDFQRQTAGHCLVNAVAWMPLPDLPETRGTGSDNV